jgi:hypothetical protein
LRAPRSKTKKMVRKQIGRGGKRSQEQTVAGQLGLTPTEKTRLKLTIELVPGTSWYKSLNKLLPRSEWDRVRRRAYAQYGHRCGICGAEGRLNCHELWEYNDATHVQRLSGFIALCDLCHFVKHLGFAGILAAEGKLDIESIVRHFMNVNQCDREAYEKHREQAFRQWAARSRHKWSIDFGMCAGFMEQKGSD